MMEIPKKQYQAPALTIVEVKIERGYALSSIDVEMLDPAKMAEEINSIQQRQQISGDQGYFGNNYFAEGEDGEDHWF